MENHFKIELSPDLLFPLVAIVAGFPAAVASGKVRRGNGRNGIYFYLF